MQTRLWQSHLLRWLTLAIGLAPVVSLDAAKPVPNTIPATVQFLNANGDRILGDGQDYEDGIGGVRCVIHRTGDGFTGTGDMILDTSERQGTRRVQLTLAEPYAWNDPQLANCPWINTLLAPNQSYALNETIWINVGQIWQLPVGESAFKPCEIHTSQGSVRFGTWTSTSRDYCLRGTAEPGVWVTRTAIDTWQVSATPNVIAVLLRQYRGDRIPVNYYYLPVHMMITVPSLTP
jgi:hypothetical protein